MAAHRFGEQTFSVATGGDFKDAVLKVASVVIGASIVRGGVLAGIALAGTTVIVMPPVAGGAELAIATEGSLIASSEAGAAPGGGTAQEESQAAEGAWTATTTSDVVQ